MDHRWDKQTVTIMHCCSYAKYAKIPAISRDWCTATNNSYKSPAYILLLKNEDGFFVVYIFIIWKEGLVQRQPNNLRSVTESNYGAALSTVGKLQGTSEQRLFSPASHHLPHTLAHPSGECQAIFTELLLEITYMLCLIYYFSKYLI